MNTIEHQRLGHTLPGFDKFVRLPLTLWLDGALGVRSGGNADGVFIGGFTRQAVGAGFQFDESAGTYVNETTDINSAGAGDVTLFPATEAVGDAFYFGHTGDKFTAIQATISTAGIDGVVAWEYWNGNAWTNLATAHNLSDTTASFTAAAGTYFVSWTIPSNWATTTVNSVTGYFVRARVTTVYSTNPALTRAWLHTIGEGVGVGAPAYGYLTDIAWSADVNSVGGQDTVINIINVTRGVATSATLTEGDKAGQAAVAATNGIYFERGDRIIVQVTQDDNSGSPFTDVNLVLYFKI